MQLYAEPRYYYSAGRANLISSECAPLLRSARVYVFFPYITAPQRYEGVTVLEQY